MDSDFNYPRRRLRKTKPAINSSNKDDTHPGNCEPCPAQKDSEIRYHSIKLTVIFTKDRNKVKGGSS